MKEKKCKVCRDKFTPIRSLQMVCSPTCGYEYSKQLKSKEWSKKKKQMKEEFRDVKGYEGVYQISNYGNVKSLSRTVNNNGGVTVRKERILKAGRGSNGRMYVVFSLDGKAKTYSVHQLVAMAFLNHKPCGYKLVVNHKDFNPINNNVSNLEIVTQRENANKKHLKSSSKYTGVDWFKRDKKWRATITINNKTKHLGLFNCELAASQAYQKALKQL